LKGFDIGEPVDRDFDGFGKLTTRTRIFFEHVSAFRHRFIDRPVGGKILAWLNSGDVLLVSKLDRAWRKTSDCLKTLEDLKARGVIVYVLTFLDGEPIRIDTAAGKILLTVCACFAEVESMFRSERIKDCRAIRDANRLCNGGTRRVSVDFLNPATGVPA
jgi:DNA invertase Pin-like site-specific DNA recombinase